MQSCSRRLRDVKNAAVLASLTLAGVGCESIPSLRQTSDPFSVAVSRDNEATSSSSALSPETAAIDEARLHFSAGRFDQTQAILSEQLKRSPKDTAAIELLADAALSCGDWRLHHAALVQLVKLHSDSGTIQNRTGLKLLQSARLRLADHGDSSKRAAESQILAEEFVEDGLDFLRRAVAREPRNVRFAQDLAGALVDQKLYAEADAVLAAAMLRNLTDRTLPITAARFYEGIGNWPRAVTCYDTGLRNSPDNRLWLRGRAMCHYRQGELTKAADDFTAALRGTPVERQLAEYIAWGDACLNIGQADKAQGIFDYIAREEKFRTADLELLRSVCRVRQGQIAEAAMILERALADWPEHRNLRELASRLPARSPPPDAETMPKTAQLMSDSQDANMAL
jgi:tetratricopeptide (TPR) repeat protein